MVGACISSEWRKAGFLMVDRLSGQVERSELRRRDIERAKEMR